MTSCDEATPLLARHADGSLDNERRARLEAHLAACADCRRALEDQRAVIAILARRADAPAPADFAARIVSRVRSDPGWLNLLEWRTWTVRLAPVAAALLLIAIVLQVRSATPATPDDLTTVVQSLALERDQTELPPSAVLWRTDISSDSALFTVLTGRATTDGSNDER